MSKVERWWQNGNNLVPIHRWASSSSSSDRSDSAVRCDRPITATDGGGADADGQLQQPFASSGNVCGREGSDGVRRRQVQRRRAKVKCCNCNWAKDIDRTIVWATFEGTIGGGEPGEAKGNSIHVMQDTSLDGAMGIVDIGAIDDSLNQQTHRMNRQVRISDKSAFCIGLKLD